jgi:hypothetical protein
VSPAELMPPTLLADPGPEPAQAAPATSWRGSGPPAGGRPEAFLALDRGTATLAGSIVGRVDRRWRLLAATALPVGSDPGALLGVLVDRFRLADPVLAENMLGRPAAGLESVDGWPQLVALSAPAATLVVIAATDRTRARLEEAALGAGWNVVGGSAERTDPLALTRLATRPGVDALLIGVADPPDADERELAAELAVAGAGVAIRRPGLDIFLSGSVPDAPLLDVLRDPVIVRLAAPPRMPGEVAPASLRLALAAARRRPDDGRAALAAAAGSLARVLGLRVEVLDIGVSGAARILASPGLGNDGGIVADVRMLEVPGAALFRIDQPGTIERIDHWFTQGLDRARLRDRLAELALAPWSDLEGDGALLRAAVLRAALERLLEASRPTLGDDGVDLVVGTGGAWSAVPGPAAAHVVADVVRRPGAMQVAVDHARLLGPIGTIADDAERDAVCADLAEDALLRLGTIVTPRGLRANRAAGHLEISSGGVRSEVDLVAGGLTLVDLPPGARGTAELTFRGAAELGVRGRRFQVQVTGGLAGLMLDLRDVPLRLPERPDRRREILTTWEQALWPEREA